MIPCAYCEKPCQPTREHIVPSWYSRTPGESETFNARQPYTHVKGDLMIKDVCSTCNGGVLCDLDAYGKKLYEDYFTSPVRLGDVVDVEFDFNLLARWLLKLSFNSGRANGTDLRVLAQCREVIFGNQPVGTNIFLSCHLIGPSIVDLKNRAVRPAAPSGHEEEPMSPQWFRICQMRLPISPVTQLAQRSILINSYAFSIIIAPTELESPNELQDAISVFRNLFPSSAELRSNAKKTRLICNWDHAAQSIEQLYFSFPNRFGFESNGYTKRLLREQSGFTILALTNDIIEAGDVRSASDALNSMVRNREMAFAHRTRVGLMIDGYDDDPRELWEVLEVREYIRELFLECPFVMLLAHPDLALLKLFAACWLFEPNANSHETMKAREFDFLQRCFLGNNEVAYRLCISPQVQKEIEKTALQTLYLDLPAQEFDAIVSRSEIANG